MPEENSKPTLQITFYVSERSEPELVACRVAQKAVSQGHEVHIRTSGPDASSQMDRQLWTFQKQSFLPHSIGEPTTEHVHVTLHEDWMPPQRDVLINLGTEVPEDFEGYSRIIEIIPPNPDGRDAGRARFRKYRDLGLEPETHNLTN